jgi:hypothetical protein
MMAVMRLAAYVLVAVLASTTASAATLDEIVALSKAGVSDSVILGLIDRDRTIFTLDSDQLVMLKQQGVSDAVVLAMLKSGRAEADAAARAENELRMANIAATAAPAPDVVVVGHGPDVPNGGLPAPPAQEFVVPYGVPYGPVFPYVPSAAPHHGRVAPNHRPAPPAADRALCVARPAPRSSVTSRGVGLITVCADSGQLYTRQR